MSHAVQTPVRDSAPLTAGKVVRVRFHEVLLTTVCLALTAGLAETAILAGQRYLLGRVIYRSDHYLWMPAVGAVIVFGAVMVVLWLFGRLLPALRKPRFVSTVLLGLTIFSVLMVGRWITPVSALLLSIGAAVMLSGRQGATAAVQRFSRRTTVPMAIAVLVLAIISFTARPWLERRNTSAVAAGDAGAPNIIFLILDTVRARSLSLYGYARNTTPHLAQLAQQGVVFERAIAPAPWTLPSHGTMFTGKPPQDLNADRFTPLNDQYRVLAEALSARGYITAGFAANLAYTTREFGLARGFQHWNDYPVNIAQILANSSLGRFLLLERYSGDRNSWLLRSLGIDQWVGHTRTAADVNDKLVDWVSTQRHRPFFVFANYFDAHWPYLPPKPYLGSLGPIRQRSFAQRFREEGPGKWPKRGAPEFERAMRDRYEESIAYIDAQVGALMADLRARGLLENTVVVIGSDHGEEFGENGDYEHDTDLSFAQTRVPLLIVAPGRVPQGVRVTQPVGLGDLPATLMELSGGKPGSFPGTSMTSLWSSNPPQHVAPVFAILEKRGKSQGAIVTAQYHYIRSKHGAEQLYDHVADIDEAHDLSRTPAAASVLAQLRAELWRHTAGHPFGTKKR